MLLHRLCCAWKRQAKLNTAEKKMLGVPDLGLRVVIVFESSGIIIARTTVTGAYFYYRAL